MNCNSHAPQGTKPHHRDKIHHFCTLQLTRPTGDETTKCALTYLSDPYCNTHAPQGTKLYAVWDAYGLEGIATHTPHRGRNNFHDFKTVTSKIATHTPHRGRNKQFLLYTIGNSSLQLTRPTGDETIFVRTIPTFLGLQLTRPTGDETGFGSGFGSGLNYCNSHAPQGTKLGSVRGSGRD